jgi:1-acyl-sn-glycerol-3-phosphate acyltransferase
VADAEVIPIGGRGRPGRGSRTSPSAAARALAGTRGEVKPTGRAKRPGKAEADQPAGPDQVSEPTGGESSAPATSATDPSVESTSGTEAMAESAPAAESARASGASGSPLVSEPTAETALRAADLADAVSDAAREVFAGERGSWDQRLAEWLSFLRRRLSGDYEVDEFGFDQEITERFLLTALRPVAEKWFRIEVRGIENIPATEGALVVSNHSGTVPIDGLMTGLLIHDHTGRFLRMLGADLVFRMPFVGEFARKGGATLASNEDAERMLSRGDLVGVWPEGFKGVGKPFAERYKLQRFGRGGFVTAALRTGVPIVPCSVVGAEEIYPLVGDIPSLARLLGVPYIPITPFFPLFGPLGLIPLPSKWLIEFGEPIRTDSYGAGAADDPMLVFNVTDQVRETIQHTLYSLLIQRRGVFS